MKHHGVSNSFFAGTRSDVSDRIHRASIALLASVCLSAAGPLHSKLLVTEVDTHTIAILHTPVISHLSLLPSMPHEAFS